MKEICYILIGKRMGRFWFGRLVKKTTGTASSVEFDWEWVLRREEEKGDVLGFWHTHETDIRPSSRDIETMLAWIRCFGRALVCIIQTENYRAGYVCGTRQPAFVSNGNIVIYRERELCVWKFFSRIFQFADFFFGVERSEIKDRE